VGIPDERSYLWRSYLPLPSGRVTGWRRRALQVFVLVMVLWSIGAFAWMLFADNAG
jgi:hypothetical protein